MRTDRVRDLRIVHESFLVTLPDIPNIDTLRGVVHPDHGWGPAGSGLYLQVEAVGDYRSRQRPAIPRGYPMRVTVAARALRQGDTAPYAGSDQEVTSSD